jgi:hypothetical protein
MASSDRLRELLRVAPYSPDYPAAVKEVAGRVWAKGGMSYEVDQFVTPFLASRHNAGDADTLYTLGLIFERSAVDGSAAAAFRAALAVVPDHRDAARRLAAVGAPLLPDVPPLDDFPELPDLPDLASVTARADATVLRAVSTRSAELGMVPLHVGETVADRYRIVAALGAGGYAVVFRATDLPLEEDLALKLFRPTLATEAELKRFKQELRITRRLAHPNVVATYDFGTWKDLAFITMELLEGEDLGRILDAKRLPLEVALRLSRQAFLGLGAAHDVGIVHRDVKPSNLFVLHDMKTLKVMDFGLATAHDMGRQYTRPGRIVGTPAYLAPERLDGEQDVDRSVDIYAMGVVLYEAVVGKLPFRRAHLQGLFKQILSEPPVAPKERVSSVPDLINDLILSLLEKDPANRPSTCAEALSVLNTVLGV